LCNLPTSPDSTAIKNSSDDSSNDDNCHDDNSNDDNCHDDNCHDDNCHDDNSSQLPSGELSIACIESMWMIHFLTETLQFPDDLAKIKT